MTLIIALLELELNPKSYVVVLKNSCEVQSQYVQLIFDLKGFKRGRKTIEYDIQLLENLKILQDADFLEIEGRYKFIRGKKKKEN